MNLRGFGFGVLAFALVTVACARTLPTYRYRITVEVETPQGLRSGSSVIEIGGRQNTANAPGDARNKINRSVRGEAVAVDLPGGKVLFALLNKADRLAEIALRAPSSNEDNAYDLMVAWMRAHPGPAVLPPHDPRADLKIYRDGPNTMERIGPIPPDRLFDYYPMLVTFGDLNDPKSVKKVDPGNLYATFGTGVRLKRITLELTDAPITFAINKRLVWLATQHGSLDYTGALHPDHPEKDVTQSDFKMGN